MAITFKEFQTKAEGVDVHPERTEQPWQYALTGLNENSGKFAKILQEELPKGSLTASGREKAIENAWMALWHLAVACRSAGISLEEVAERGFFELDHVGDHHLPENGR